MHKLPTDFNGSFLIGQSLNLICFGAYQVYLHFGPDVLITIESAYSCHRKPGPAPQRVAPPVCHPDLMSLLEKRVTRVLGDTQGTLTLEFDDGHVLACYDTSNLHESYSIKHGERTIHV